MLGGLDWADVGRVRCAGRREGRRAAACDGKCHQAAVGFNHDVVLCPVRTQLNHQVILGLELLAV